MEIPLTLKTSTDPKEAFALQEKYALEVVHKNQAAIFFLARL